MGIDEGKEAAIKGLHMYRTELLAQIRQMQENLHHVERSIELLSGGQSVVSSTVKPPGTTLMPESATISGSSYASMKPQAGAEAFLKENPGRWFKASVVAKELLRRGMPKTTKAFQSSVAGALNRAVEKGVAVREKREGRLMYAWRTEEIRTEELTDGG